MKNLHYIIIPILLAAISCTPAKEPIRYGQDKCGHCTMTIVDTKFGGELVTGKGKVYKFDATECIVNFISSKGLSESDLSFLLTNTYDKPGELIPVENCYFLQSEKMPSPMGMNINPFSGESPAKEYRDSNGGAIYSWNDLKSHLNKF